MAAEEEGTISIIFLLITRLISSFSCMHVFFLSEVEAEEVEVEEAGKLGLQ